MSTLVALVIVSLGLVFYVELIRALPWPARWLTIKPLSCDVCMSGWGGIALALMRWAGLNFLPADSVLAACAGLSVILLAVLRWLRASANFASPPT